LLLAQGKGERRIGPGLGEAWHSKTSPDPARGEKSVPSETVDRGQGRIEHRCLTASDALVGDSDWPGLRQVFRLERATVLLTTGEVRAAIVYGVTSLDRAHATVERLLRLTW
jgi:hypothetical protein